MTYCTNCGKESSKRICLHCGVKKNTTHRYCEWCGNPINENAIICTDCHERVKPGASGIFAGILDWIAIAFLVLFFIGLLMQHAILAAVLCAIGLLLLLPFTKKAIKKCTFRRLTLRKILYSVRVAAVVAFFFVAALNAGNPDYVFSEKSATKAAEVIFHEEVLLKNEASYVLNNSEVSYHTESYDGQDELHLVTVIIDYSAQNGFGGINRKQYPIKILFNTQDGTYRRLDGSVIK